MPKRTDIKSVMVIGSGPIVIGQACEFDYSGTQACRVLKAEGLRVILVNSNPATIMTDPEFADATYVEPITPEFVEKVIAKERPDALLPTLGGQTALNAAMNLHAERGILKRDGLKRQIGLPTGKVRRTFDDNPQRRGVVLRSDAKVDRQLRILASVKTDSIRFDPPLLFDESLLHFALQLGEFALHLPFLQFPFVLLCDRIRLVQLLLRLGGETLR